MRRLLRSLSLLLAVAAPVIAAIPASAHEGAGRMTIESAEARADSVHYRVRLVYEGDGDPVDDATITAVVVGAPSATPQAFQPAGADGVYEATVRLPGPGVWTVRLTSVTPPATAERTEAVAAPATTAPTPTSSPPTTQANPGDDGNDSSADPVDDGNDSSAAPLVVGGAAAAAVLALAAFRAVGRRTP